MNASSLFGLGKLAEFIGEFLKSDEGQKAMKQRVSGWLGFGVVDEEIMRKLLHALDTLMDSSTPAQLDPNGKLYRVAIEQLLKKLNEDERDRFRYIIASFEVPIVKTESIPVIMTNPDGTPIIEKGRNRVEVKKTETRIDFTGSDPRVQCLIGIAKDWIACRDNDGSTHAGDEHQGQCAIRQLKLIGWILERPIYVRIWSKAKEGFLEVMGTAQAELLAANGVWTLDGLEAKIQADRNTIRADHARDKKSLLNNPATWAMVAVIIVLLLSAKLF